MIVTRTEMLNGRAFVVTTSDSGFMIERNSARYSEAWDPVGSGRVYTETDEKIEETTIEDRLTPIVREVN